MDNEYTGAIEVVAAAIAFQVGDDRKYFTAQRDVNDAYAELWEFPGGKVDPEDDGDHHVALKRELMEELNLQVEYISKRPIRTFTLYGNGHTYHQFFYEVQINHRHMAADLRLNVHQDHAWLPLSVLAGMSNVTPGTRACVQRLVEKQKC